MFAKIGLILLKVSFVMKILNCPISDNTRKNCAVKIKGFIREKSSS